MTKQSEIDYIKTVAERGTIALQEFLEYLYNKPYSDGECWRYLVDIGQILKFLPPKPCRILDLGVGSGWTSEIFARCGYSIVGIDISPDMIALAQKRKNSLALSSVDLKFYTADFENPLPFGLFDAAVSYDSLHHAEDEALVLQRVHDVLTPTGVYIIVEPGKGHSQAEYSVEAMEKYGTTEKEMLFSNIEPLLKKAGFKRITQYLRLGCFELVDISSEAYLAQQEEAFKGLCWSTVKLGHSSIIVAHMDEEKKSDVDGDRAPSWFEQFSELNRLLQESEADRLVRFEQINELTEMLKESDADRSSRFEQITELTKMLKKSDADRSSRFEQITELTGMLREAEVDRLARFEQITELTRLAGELNGHLNMLNSRLDIIQKNRLYALLKKIKLVP